MYGNGNWLAQFGRSVQRLVVNLFLISLVGGVFEQFGVVFGIFAAAGLLWYWGFCSWQSAEAERTGTRPPFFRRVEPEWWEDGPDRQYQDIV